MAVHRFLLLLLLSVLLLPTATFATAADAKPTAYEMLEKFGFPKGVLPEGVRGYELKKNGSFEVFLGGECEFKLDGGYVLKYQDKISGKVDLGRLAELKGVAVKVYLMHWGIDKVLSIDGELRFYVGPLSQSFQAGQFEQCPQCRCGFNCGGDRSADATMAAAI